MPTSRAARDRRREALVRLLQEEPMASQEDAVRRLAELGHAVTQSSISRDLREIGAVKTPEGYRLGAATVVDGGPGASNGSFAGGTGAGGGGPAAAWVSAVERIVWAGPNLVVLRTATGAAPQIGLAVDALAWPQVAGTVAGDDTLMIAVRDGGRPALRAHFARIGLRERDDG